MARALIGRTVRRLRSEQRLSQQALAVRLGISASYLNLIEHDQRAVTASLLIKLGETLRVDLATLSGSGERQLEVSLREAFADPLLSADAVPEAEIAELAATAPNAARAVLALYRAWRVAREDAGGIALPSGRRVLLPNEEARDFFDDRANHFPSLETAAEAIAGELRAAPAEMNHAIAERLRREHGLTVTVQKLEGALRRYDPATRSLALSEMLPRESRGFHMAFQLALLEARDVAETIVADAAPSSPEAGDADPRRIAELRRRRAADALRRVADAARALRHDMEALAARFGVSFEQACHRLSTLQRPGRARRAVLLPARRSGGQRVEALLGRGVSVRPLWRIVSALGGAHRIRSARPGAGAGRRIARRRGVSVLRAHRDAAGAGLGRSAGRCMWWRWAAAWRMPRMSPTRTGSIWSTRRWGSDCRAGCATGRTAAAGRFRRWSIGWRWIRIPPA